MARPKKKNSNPQQSMEKLLANTVALYSVPYDDRDGERDSELLSLRTVADQLGTTVLRVRKLLITAEYFSSALSRQVQQMAAEGNSVEAVMRMTGLKRASVYSYLPYVGLAFNLEQTTVNADRHRLFRKRLKAIEALQRCMDLPDELEYLWKAVLAFEGYPFQTAGRGKTPGIKFSYQVKRSRDGQPVGEIIICRKDGMPVGEYKVSRKEKTIARVTIELAYRRAKFMGGMVSGPKKLGVFGASYLYPMLVRFGVIKLKALLL